MNMAHGRGKHFDIAAFMTEKHKEKARLLELNMVAHKGHGKFTKFNAQLC